jgi:dTDP-4-dehydrorhamnose reductase
MKYLIFGAGGQLGQEFLKRLKSEESKRNSVLGLKREECDISDFDQVKKVFEEYKPDVVINCAAYNAVDKAEEDYVTAFKVNASGVKNLAYACRKFKSFLIHFSTDYVFDGKKENGLYVEEDSPFPLSEYGRSKLIGEIFLKEETENFLIFRVSWVYGNGKQNFIYKLLSWAQNNEYLKVSYDEISVPTSTNTIVNYTLKAFKSGLKGLYHLTNSGCASRYEWAKKIIEIKGIKKFIRPVSSSIFSLPAKRPEFSAMSNEKLSKLLNVEIPTWEEELVSFLKGI